MRRQSKLSDRYQDRYYPFQQGKGRATLPVVPSIVRTQSKLAAIVVDHIFGFHFFPNCYSEGVAEEKLSSWTVQSPPSHALRRQGCGSAIHCYEQSCGFDLASNAFESCEHDQPLLRLLAAMQRPDNVLNRNRYDRAYATCVQYLDLRGRIELQPLMHFLDDYGPRDGYGSGERDD